MDSSNISLANSYKKEIIINSEKYLESNEINLDELEVGEKMEISASEIVDDNKYETC